MNNRPLLSPPSKKIPKDAARAVKRVVELKNRHGGPNRLNGSIKALAAMGDRDLDGEDVRRLPPDIVRPYTSNLTTYFCPRPATRQQT